MRTPSPEYFANAVWWTPNQIRDSFFDYSTEITTAYVQELKVLALNEQARRKQLPLEFIECPFCKGYHGQLANIDNLCEIHEAQFAAARYDALH